MISDQILPMGASNMQPNRVLRESKSNREKREEEISGEWTQWRMETSRCFSGAQSADGNWTQLKCHVGFKLAIDRPSRLGVAMMGSIFQLSC